jgi:ribosome biogenesis protein Tsr3
LFSLLGPLMDNVTARAISLALAVHSLSNQAYSLKSLFHWADRFYEYIISNGKWPKEAVSQLGKEEVREEEVS